MKKLLYLSILLYYMKPYAGYSSGNIAGMVKVTLSGTIRDAKTGEALPGASIFFPDNKIGAIADQDGKYSISNIPDGHHIIEVSHTGYATLVEHIELNADTKKDFSLSSVVLENQGVIVTGVSGATSIRKAPVPVSSIRRTALLQTSSTNLVDALTHVPGVSQLSSGPAVSKPFIRGLGYNRVVVVNEGVRQEGQQWGDEHGMEIDEMSVNRVELLKGPASLIYGSDALAGVINIITHIPVAEGQLKGNILSNFQSNGNLVGLNGSLSGNKNGFNWNFYLSGKSAGDYKNRYDGKVLNSRFRETNFGGYIGINKSWGYSHLVLGRFNQEIGMIEGERDDATGRFILYGGSPLERIATAEDLRGRKPFIPRQEVQHLKLVSDNNFSLRKSRLKLNLAFQQNQRKEFGDPENPLDEELFFDLNTFNYSFHWQLPDFREWHTTVGLNGMQQSNRNQGPELIIPEYRLFDLGLFVYAQRQFRKITVSGGFRFDNRSLETDEFFEGSEPRFKALSLDFSNFSGSAGFSYEPFENLTIKLNLARGFRAPSLAELSSNGVHEGTNRYEYGDASLRSETSLQTDMGFAIDYEHFSIGLSAFYNRMNGFIFYRKLESVFGGDSLVTVDGNDIPAFQFNQQDATLRGLEASLDIHPHPLDWLHFEHVFSMVRGTFDDAIDGSQNLPLMPAARLVNELKADFTKPGKSLRNLYLKLEADNYFEQKNPFTGFGTETKTRGYTLFHFGSGIDIFNAPKKKTVLGIHFSITNITDRAYQNHLSRLKYTATNNVSGRTGVFNMGRNFSIKLNVPFGK